MTVAAVAAARGIRLAVFDVDGVLTDGKLFYGADGGEYKAFHVRDGLGIKLLQRAGITPAVVSGRDSAALRLRLSALGVVHARLGTEDKAPAAEAILAELGLDWGAAAAMGDDWPDLPLLRRATLAAAPPTAHAEVLAIAHHVTERQPGAGAVREFCDLLLVASGAYARELEAAAR